MCITFNYPINQLTSISLIVMMTHGTNHKLLIFVQIDNFEMMNVAILFLLSLFTRWLHFELPQKQPVDLGVGLMVCILSTINIVCIKFLTYVYCHTASYPPNTT